MKSLDEIRNAAMRREYVLGGYWYSTGYDLVGRPTNATDSVSLMHEWLYNNRSELAAASIGTNLYGYSYDTIGNRLWSADNMITNCYAANSLNQYTTVGRAAPSVPQTSLAYDADGNMTRDGTYVYSYDAENRLRSVTSRTLTNGALRVLNAYDHRNRRIHKTVQRLHSTSAPPPAPPSGTDERQTLETHTFVWDSNNIILEKVEFADGSIRTFEYYWGMDKSGTEQGAGGVGGLLAVSRNGQFYFPSFDNNGNVTKYIDESGNIVAAYEYDDFGRTIFQSGPLADFFRHRFSTKYYDPETHLYYYIYRFYSPDWHVWLNRDPIEETALNNLYGFLSNDSLSETDFLGNAKNSDKRETKWTLVIDTVEWHVWNCDEFKKRGTRSAYINHFMNMTFRDYPEGVKWYFAYQIVNEIGIDSDNNSCWSCRLRPFRLYRKTNGKRTKYLVKTHADQIEKHPTCCLEDKIKMPDVGWITIGPYTYTE